MRTAIAIAFAASLVAMVHAQAAVDIVIDKSSQQMTVTVDGEVQHQWPVSTGTARYDTPGGQYRAISMAEQHVSKEWDDAPMPHSIFFTERGHAIHGSWDVRRLGSPASHGCVRLAPTHAEQLFRLVKAQGLSNTSVMLTGEIALAARSPGDRRARQASADERKLANERRQPKPTAHRPQRRSSDERSHEAPNEAPTSPRAAPDSPRPTRSALRPGTKQPAADPYRIPQPPVGYARGANGQVFYVAPRGYVFATGLRYSPASR